MKMCFSCSSCLVPRRFSECKHLFWHNVDIPPAMFSDVHSSAEETLNVLALQKDRMSKNSTTDVMLERQMQITQ